MMTIDSSPIHRQFIARSDRRASRRYMADELHPTCLCTVATAGTGLAGGIGANLISELVQRGHDDATCGAVIAQLADNPATHPALQQLVAASGIFELVTSALAGHADQLAQLRAELQMLADHASRSSSACSP